MEKGKNIILMAILNLKENMQMEKEKKVNIMNIILMILKKVYKIQKKVKYEKIRK